MNSILFGEILCHRIPYSKALRRHAERRIRDWISSHGFEEYPKGLTYVVVLTREGTGHMVRCEISISAKAERWSGYSWARTPEEAISQTLARMRQLAPQPDPSLGARPISDFEPQIA